MNLTIPATVKEAWEAAREARISDDPLIVAAEAFKSSYDPSPAASHDWVYEYATAAYERSAKAFDKLDDKASDIIKYLGGGTGLLTIAALANMRAENAGIIAWSLPAFASAIVAIYYAIMARKPNDTVEPPSVEVACRYAEHHGQADGPDDIAAAKDRAKAKFLGEWHVAVVGMDLAVTQKAGRVRFATWFYLFAIALLLLPVVAEYLKISRP